MFKGKNILITGGTGSFGSSFIEYIIKKKIPYKEIRILSRDEKKQDDLRRVLNLENIKFFIGDVKDLSSLEVVFNNVDYVFHASAYKQVPSCEFFPLEAYKTNVLGTENVLQKSIQHKVKRVVCLSTDKAVYPINAMGISKAMMEKVALSKSLLKQNYTKICVTRYGNVLASRGSVIPLFINQILENKPITVTDLGMTRFLMPMNNAIKLVLYALKKGNNGDLFVQKTPSAKIITLLEALFEIFKKKKRKINIIGSRHGEKLHESLLTAEETARCTEQDNYFKITCDHRNLNYNLYYSQGSKKKKIIREYSSNNADILTVKEVKKMLLNLDIVKKRI
jgi:UDP-glucose 4-epimerase